MSQSTATTAVPAGPGDSAGGDYSVAPIDAMDALCRDHDIQYGYAANDAANSARIIADADIALLRGISNLLAQNALPNMPPEMQLDAAGIAYAGLAAQAFSAKVMTIDTYNGLKGAEHASGNVGFYPSTQTAQLH